MFEAGPLKSCRGAMKPEARLLILDRVMPERIEPSPDVQAKVLLDLTMMIMHGDARERTLRGFANLLAAAELRLLRVVPIRAPVGLIEAALA